MMEIGLSFPRRGTSFFQREDSAPRSRDRLAAESLALADRLPALHIEAGRIAATVVSGWHGRARAGSGEDFWQFRPFQSGEPARLIDWRRSARDHHLFVREHELENAHTVWLWADTSASMRFRSAAASSTKEDRALVLLLAVSECLVAAGERVGLMGASRAFSGRTAGRRLAEALLAAEPRADLPSESRISRFHDVLLISDFLMEPARLEPFLARIAALGARAHLVQLLDPAEETFPYAGRTEFVDPENGRRYTAGRAEALRGAYVQELARARDHLKTIARANGWSFILHHTDRPATEPLLTLNGLLRENRRR